MSHVDQVCRTEEKCCILHINGGLILVAAVSFKKRIAIPVLQVICVVALTHDAKMLAKPPW